MSGEFSSLGDLARAFREGDIDLPASCLKCNTEFEVKAAEVMRHADVTCTGCGVIIELKG